MAGAGAKKRLEENRRHLNVLRIWLATGFITHFVVRLLLKGSSATTWHWLGLGATTLVNYISFFMITQHAKPTYDANGDLLDGGGSMSMKGINAYCHDLLYITSFVQCGTAFFSWFWYVYLLVPAYGLYKLFQNVVVPWFSSSKQQAPVMDEETRKKMERAEKRAQARARKWR